MNNSKKSNGWIWRTIAIILAAIIALAAWVARGYIKDHEQADHAQRAVYLKEEVMHNKQLANSDSILAHISTIKDSVVHASDSVIKRREATIRSLAGRRAPISVIIDADSLEFTRAQLENRDSTIDEQSGLIGNLKGRISEVNRLEDEEDVAQDKKEEEYRRYSWQVVHQRDSVQEIADKAQKRADRNIVISAGASATATTDGIKYGPSITIGYKIASFRLWKKRK